MRRFLLSLALIGMAVPIRAAIPIVGYVQVNPPKAPQPGAFNMQGGTVGTFTDTGLAPNQCVQTGPGGILTTSGLLCNSGGGGGGGGGNGTITPSPQFQITFYSASGATTTVSGTTGITTDSTLSNLNVAGTLSASTITLTNVILSQQSGNPIFGVSGSGQSNTYAGNLAGNLAGTGLGNAAFGSAALSNLTTGQANIGIGNAALNGDTGASFNAALGVNSLGGVTEGSGNTALGYASGFNSSTGNGVINGSSNTFVGFNSGTSNASLVNGIAIGANSVVTTNNTAVIGGAAATPNAINLIVSTLTTTNIGVNVSAVGNQSIRIDNPGTSGDAYALNSTADGVGGATHYGNYSWASGGATNNYAYYVGAGDVKLDHPINSLLATNSIGMIISTTVTGGFQIYPATGVPNFPLGVLVSSAITLSGVGNFSFLNAPDNTLYQVIGTSITIPRGDAVVMGASNTIVDGGIGGSALLSSNNTWTGNNTYTQTVLVSSSLITNSVGGNTLFSRNGLTGGSTSQVTIYGGASGPGENLLDIGSGGQGDQVIIADRTEAKFNRYGAEIGLLHVGDAGVQNTVSSASDGTQFQNFCDGTCSMELASRGNGQDIYFTQTNGGEQGRFSNVTGFTVSSSETVKGAGGLGVKFGVIAGSVTASNLTNGQCVQAGTNGLLTSSGGACGGGGGGSSNLQVTWSGVQITSPTLSLNINNPQFLLAAVGSTSTIALNPSSVTLQGQNVIDLTSSLQSGATFYVSSGTIAGPFNTTSGNISLGNLSSQLFVPNFGNGIGGNKFIIISNNAGNPLASGPILSTDLPGGSTLYIQNQSSLESGATFYVSSGTAVSLNAGNANITGTINILNNDGSASSVIDGVGTLGQQQLQITAANGIGINTAPMAGQDLALPEIDVGSIATLNSASFPKISSTTAGVQGGRGVIWNDTINDALELSNDGGTPGLIMITTNTSPTAGDQVLFGPFTRLIDAGPPLTLASILASTNAWTAGQTFKSSSTFSGNIAVSSGVLLNGSAGTSGQVYTSGGAGAVPSWTTVSGSGGSSTTTVQLNGSTLSSATTNFNFIPASGVTITISTPTANNVSITESADTAVMLTRATDQAATDISLIPTSGSGSSYVVCPTPTISSYTQNQRFILVPDSTSLNSPTVNICGLGPIALTKNQGSTDVALVAGDLSNGIPYIIVAASSPVAAFQVQPVFFSTATASGGGGNFINNSSTLQSGATFYVSSGTVAGKLTTQQIVNGTQFTMGNQTSAGHNIDSFTINDVGAQATQFGWDNGGTGYYWQNNSSQNILTLNTVTGALAATGPVSISSYTTITTTGPTAGLYVTGTGGEYGTNNPGSGAFEVDCSNAGTDGNCAQFYSNQGTQTALDAVVTIDQANVNYNERPLYMIANGQANSPLNMPRMDGYQYSGYTMEDTTRNGDGINGIYQMSDHNNALRLERRISGSFENGLLVAASTATGVVAINSDYGIPVSTLEVAGNGAFGAANEGIAAPLNGLLVQGNVILQSSMSVGSPTSTISLTTNTFVEGSLQVSSIPFTPSAFSGGSGEIQIRPSQGNGATVSRIYFYNGSGTAQASIAVTNGGGMTLGTDSSTPINISPNGNNGVIVGGSSGMVTFPKGITVSASSSTFNTNVLVKSSITVVSPITNSYEQTFSTSSTNLQSGVPYNVAITTNGFISVSGSTQPTLSGCGTSPTIVGNDTAFTITPGATAAGCTATFNPPFKNTPICNVTEQTDSVVNALSYTESATALTLTQTGLSSKIDVHCFGNGE